MIKWDDLQSNRTLYRWQEEAIEVVREAWKTDEPNTTIAAVTGAGKTEVAVRLINEWDGIVTVVVPRKALMLQWRDDLEPYAIVGRFGGGSIRGWGDETGYINIATLNAMRSGKLASYLNDFLDRKHLIIVDECHNLRGNKSRKALDNIPCDAVIGLSATPHPTKEAKEVVEALCGPIRYSYRYGQALHDGVIPPFVLHAVQIPMENAERNELASIDNRIKKAMKESREWWGERRGREMLELAKRLGMMRKRLLNDVESRYVLSSNILNQEDGVPTMVFHDTIDGVERLARMTPNLNPAIYHSKSKEGNEQIQRFLSGDTQHLYSCLALAEGFNAPRVERAVMMSGPNAPLRRIQTLGRCLRGKTDKPNEIYFLYVAGTKDEDGLHNLLKTADIPDYINGDEKRQIVNHWRWDLANGFVSIEAPKAPKAFIPSTPQKCEKCGRTFKSEVGLNSHYCRDVKWMYEDPPRTFEEMFGSD